MLTPFRRKRIIRKIYREQDRMLEETLAFQADHEITDDEQYHLQQHAKRIKKLLALLVPRDPLDWVAILTRIGVAVLLFFLLIAPPYTYIRTHYLADNAVIESSGEGTSSTRTYVPEIIVDVAGKLYTRGEIAGPVAFTHSTDFRGMTAGIVPTMVGERLGVALYWTEPVNEKLVLKRLVADEFFRPGSVVSSTLWNDQSFMSAVAVASGTDALVAAAYSDNGGSGLAIQTFDVNGQPLVARKDLPLDEPNERLDDLQAVWWEDGWAVTTRIPRKPEDSVFDPTRLVLRFFDRQLNPTRKVILEIRGYEIGKFPLLVPNLNPTAKGFNIITNAHLVIRTQREPVGDNLFTFQFDEEGVLTRLLRLTSNGREHDFWTTGYSTTQDKDYVVGVMNIPGYSHDDPKENYPRDAGRAYLRIYDKSFQIAGTIIVFNEQAVKGASDLTGVTHLRQTIVGNRAYVAFDAYNMDSSITDQPDRSVQAMWIRLRY